MKLFTRRAVVAAVVVAGIVIVSAVPATASPANEVSDAMRYGASAPLGDVIEDLVDEDDSTYTVAAPWPLNFFGQKYEGLCITTNGGVYPVVDGDASCDNVYDENVEALANSSQAPMIAVLAADIDPSECDQVRVDQRDGAGDGFGRPCTMYLDTEATIDGRDAVVITWYRVSHNDDANDETLENTFQLILIKLPTATGETVGYNFDFEFNYGTLRDGDDGYSAIDPDDSCESLSDDCRWGIGMANYVPDVLPDVLPDSAPGVESDQSSEPIADQQAVGDAAETTPTEPAATEPAATEPAAPVAEPVPLGPAAATGYEFFANYEVADLLDDGAFPLVANSLGTEVDGRYTCGMLSGQAVGCDAVQLSAPGADAGPLLAETGPSDATLFAAVFALLSAVALIAGGAALAARGPRRPVGVRSSSL